MKFGGWGASFFSFFLIYFLTGCFGWSVLFWFCSKCDDILDRDNILVYNINMLRISDDRNSYFISQVASWLIFFILLCKNSC